MVCPQFDWKEYVLGETPAAGQASLERHLGECAECRQEVESLRLTLAAMRRLPERELPRRISFVSDPVFEVSWWRRFWTSGPQLGFASAAMLSMAILVHAAIPKQPAPAPVLSSQQQVEERVAREVARRLPDEVRRMVRSELKPVLDDLTSRIEDLDKTRLAGVERRVEQQRRMDLKNIESAFDYIEKRLTTLVNARYEGD